MGVTSSMAPPACATLWAPLGSTPLRLAVAWWGIGRHLGFEPKSACLWVALGSPQRWILWFAYEKRSTNRDLDRDPTWLQLAFGSANSQRVPRLTNQPPLLK